MGKIRKVNGDIVEKKCETSAQLAVYQYRYLAIDKRMF